MNKFEMPNMDIAKFSKENIITASSESTSVTMAKGQAMNVLTSNEVETTNVFEFVY